MGVVEQLQTNQDQIFKMLFQINKKLDHIIEDDLDKHKIIGVKEISEILGIAERTLYQRWKEYAKVHPIKKNPISNRIEARKGEFLDSLR